MSAAAVTALATAAAAAAFPFVREKLRRPMDGAARADAPGEFAELSGGSTHYRWIGPLRGPIAVCVHGMTTPSYVWDGIAQGLAAMGCRVLVYDLYGRGYSDRPAGLLDRDFFLTQLEELLAQQNVKGDFLLLGYSMGGAIATAYAAKHTGRVRQLILLASGELVTEPGRLGRFIQQTPVLGDWLMQAMFPQVHMKGIRAESSLPTSVPGITALQQQELSYRGFVPAVLSSLRGILAEDLSADHRKIHQSGVPLLAVWGRDDEVVPLAAMGRLAELSRSAVQEVVDGAGHGLPYTHTDAVLEIIVESHRRGLN